jgi:hypothetical protein
MAAARGILHSDGGSLRAGLTATSYMGMRPFPEDIDRRVHGHATSTRPHVFPERDEQIEVSIRNLAGDCPL